jgi:hypothetical protein
VDVNLVLILGMLILANVAILLVDGAAMRHHALWVQALAIRIVEVEAELAALWMLLRRVQLRMTLHVTGHIRTFARTFRASR